MKVKYVLSLIVFISALLLSLALQSLNYCYQDDPSVSHLVTAFLRKDLENSRNFVSSLKNHPQVTTPSEFVAIHKIYADDIANMNLVGLPEDFQIAWLRYAKVKRDSYLFLYSLKLKTYPESLELKGSDINAWKSLTDQEKSTWNGVMSAAENYGIEFDAGGNLKTNL